MLKGTPNPPSLRGMWCINADGNFRSYGKAAAIAASRAGSQVAAGLTDWHHRLGLCPADAARSARHVARPDRHRWSKREQVAQRRAAWRAGIVFRHCGLREAIRANETMLAVAVGETHTPAPKSALSEVVAPANAQNHFPTSSFVGRCVSSSLTESALQVT